MTLQKDLPKREGSGVYPKTDKLGAREAVNRPFLIRVVKILKDFEGKFGKSDQAIVDLQDVNTGDVLIGVWWGTGAIVDRLRSLEGQDVTVTGKVTEQTGAKSGRTFLGLSDLAGDELAKAEERYNAGPRAIQDERARRVAEAEAEAGENQDSAKPVTAPPPAAPKAAEITDEAIAAARALLAAQGQAQA